MKNSSYQTTLVLTVLLLSFTVVFKGDDDWQILKTKNEIPGRSECGMAACNGKLYLIGGGALPTQVFDPAALTWSSKAKAPVDMNHFQPVSYQNKIYVLEAFSGGDYPNQDNLKNVYI